MNSCGVADVGGVDDVAQPGHRVAGRAVLVEPVRRDAELGRLVHPLGAHLDLERLAVRSDDRRVQRLVAVGLRHRDVVLEAPGHRLPERVDHADRAVAVLVAADEDAHRGQVVDLVELLPAPRHLHEDGVEVLGAARDLGLDADLLQVAAEDRAGLGDEALAIGAPLVDHGLDLGVLARVERREREVLELPLDGVDAEAVGERREDVERLLRLLDLLLLAQVGQRPHVVQPVGQLDDDDADVLRHRHDHLAVVLGLGLLAGGELDLRELGDARRPAAATSSPKRLAISSDVASVSSTTSCSSAAASTVDGWRRRAQILATPQGW